MSIVALEGPDLAGKSTLAKKFHLYNPASRILKQGPPPSGVDLLTHYLRPIAESQVDKSDVLILDRWHVGELVYGPMLRGRSLLTDVQANYIDMVLQTFGCAFLHVTAPINDLQERYDVRGDGLIKREQLPDIVIAYDTWMQRHTHWVTWSSNVWLNERYRAPMAGRYIGPDRPKVLLLGDRRNDEECELIFPFGPRRNTSGHWLMNALAMAGVNHMNVGIMNACEGSLTTDELTTQWNALGQPPVITLGANAREVWRKTQPIRTLHHLNHPQYERRFHHRAMETYGQAIKEVMKNG